MTDLDAIRQRQAAIADLLPLRYSYHHVTAYGGGKERVVLTSDVDPETCANLRPDAENPSTNGDQRLTRFVANAPRDIAEMADEIEALRADNERLIVSFTGSTSAEWEAEGERHAAFQAAENRGGGFARCKTCRLPAFIDGTADIDLDAYVCQLCRVKAERDELRALLVRLRDDYDGDYFLHFGGLRKRDHACAECVGAGMGIIKPGFQCDYHKLIATVGPFKPQERV